MVSEPPTHTNAQRITHAISAGLSIEAIQAVFYLYAGFLGYHVPFVDGRFLTGHRQPELYVIWGLQICASVTLILIALRHLKVHSAEALVLPVLVLQIVLQESVGTLAGFHHIHALILVLALPIEFLVLSFYFSDGTSPASESPSSSTIVTADRQRGNLLQRRLPRGEGVTVRRQAAAVALGVLVGLLETVEIALFLYVWDAMWRLQHSTQIGVIFFILLPAIPISAVVYAYGVLRYLRVRNAALLAVPITVAQCWLAWEVGKHLPGQTVWGFALLLAVFLPAELLLMLRLFASPADDRWGSAN